MEARICGNGGKGARTAVKFEPFSEDLRHVDSVFLAEQSLGESSS
jgi:hypothetical protein